MNKQIKKRRAVVLIMVLASLLFVSIIAFITLFLFRSQHGITRSLMQLDEVRYAKEIGLRHGLWVWRYKYDDSDYLNNGTQPYQTSLGIDGYNVNSVWVRVEDKDSDRYLDEDEIEIQVNKVSWSP